MRSVTLTSWTTLLGRSPSNRARSPRQAARPSPARTPRVPSGRPVRAVLAAGTLAALTAATAAPAVAASGMPGNGGAFELTAHSPAAAAHYAPTFTGNGLLGVRVPAAGQGYAGGTVPADSELAGFYAKPTKPAKASDGVQQRANIPTWSTLTFADGGRPVSLSTGTHT